MRRWFDTYIRSVRKDIVILFMADVAFLLVLELVLKRIPAPFHFFVRLSDFFLAIGVALVASIVFYFVQVHLPAVKEKNNLYPVIAFLFLRVLTGERLLLAGLLGLNESELSEENVLSHAGKVDLYSEAPLVLAGLNGDRKANWIEYSIYEVKRIDQSWEMLMKYSSYMDSECLALLSKMQHPGMLLGFVRATLPLCLSTKKRFSFGKGCEPIFVEFWHYIQQQQQYYDKKLERFIKRL